MLKNKQYQLTIEKQYRAEDQFFTVDANYNIEREIEKVKPIFLSLGISDHNDQLLIMNHVLKSLLIGTMTNYQTSIQLFSKLLEKGMPHYSDNISDYLELSEEWLYKLSEETFEFESIPGQSGIDYVRVHAYKRSLINLEGIIPISYPMTVLPNKIVNNYSAGYLTIDRTCLIGKSIQHSKPISLDVLNIQRQIPLTLNRKRVQEYINTPAKNFISRRNAAGYIKDQSQFRLEIANQQLLQKRMKEFVSNIGNHPIYMNCGYDSRGRLYPLATVFNYQTDKQFIELHNKRMLSNDGVKYLIMDLATHYGNCSFELNTKIHNWYKSNINEIAFGLFPLNTLNIDPQSPYKGDKSTWDMRLVQGLYHFSETPSDKDIDKPKLYHNSLEALENLINDSKPTEVLIGLDATCSAAQIISLSTGDFVGMINSNVLAYPNEDKRYDIYQAISDACNNTIDREKMKHIVMPEFYNSKAKIKEVFPDEKERKIYCEARDTTIPSGQKTLEKINALWDTKAETFSWYLPDGHYSIIRAYENTEIELDCIEIKATLLFKFREYGASEYYIPLAASIIQSIDAYINRLMIRKAHARGIPILTVHDCFLAHPNDIGTLRELFTECLIQVNEEQVLQSIFEQLGGKRLLHSTKSKVANWLKAYPNKYAIC